MSATDLAKHVKLHNRTVTAHGLTLLAIGLKNLGCHITAGNRHGLPDFMFDQSSCASGTQELVCTYVYTACTRASSLAGDSCDALHPLHS